MAANGQSLQHPHSPWIGNRAGVGCSELQHKSCCRKRAATAAAHQLQPTGSWCSTPIAPGLVMGQGLAAQSCSTHGRGPKNPESEETELTGIRAVQGPSRGEETKRAGVRIAQGLMRQDSRQPTSWPAGKGPKNPGRGPKNPGRGPRTLRVRKLSTRASVLHGGPHEVGKPSERASASHKDPHTTKKTDRQRPRSAPCVAAHVYGCTHPTACGGGQGCTAPLAPDGGRSPTVKA